MDISYSRAANAYANMQSMQGQAEEQASPAAAAGGSFTDVLSQAFDQAVSTQNKAEQLQMQSVTTGRVDMAELVTAVANAELSLNTVVAIRDRVIQAYQSIIGMAI